MIVASAGMTTTAATSPWNCRDGGVRIVFELHPQRAGQTDAASQGDLSRSSQDLNSSCAHLEANINVMRHRGKRAMDPRSRC
jgi:hypothetical protein